MKIAIRDDDLCYYTDVNIFKSVYDNIDVPINISVIPFGVSDHGNKHPYGVIDGESKSIELNLDLCQYLRHNSKYELMLHGFTHQYMSKGDGYLSEMLWRQKNECDTLMAESLSLFEKVFKTKPKVFCSPSDKGKKFLFSLLKKYGLNYCGLIKTLFSRPFSYKTLINYTRRLFSRIKYGYPYCGVLKYGGWKEIQTYQKINFEYLVNVFKICKKNNYPMVIETHYWQLNNNSNEFSTLLKFIEYAKANNAEFCFMSNIFD